MNIKHILVAAAALTIAAPASAAEVFTYSGGIVTWVAPTTGDYRVVALGAAGASAQSGRSGGRGAELDGTFAITAGQSFFIAVGGMGGTDAGDYNGGGGGGTFFVSAGATPMLIAGGGGGTRLGANQNGTDASITQFAFTASGGNSTYTPVLKTIGAGQGGIVSSASWGSAGAGFFGNGASDAPYGTGGLSFANGLAGGIGNYNAMCQGPGGFGGGGAGAGCGGGGGGGGYSGGDGGWIGGGGGSFNAGADAVARAGIGTGNGLLTISFLTPAVPEPATWAMMMLGFGGMGYALRRRRKDGPRIRFA